jgi:hypothetical protein
MGTEFRSSISLLFSVQSEIPARRLLCLSRFHVGFLLGVFFDPEDGGNVPPKCRLTFNGLHGVISEKISTLKILFFLNYGHGGRVLFVSYYEPIRI